MFIRMQRKSIRMELLRRMTEKYKLTNIYPQYYYTPKTTKIQAFLAKIAFFVDIDGYLC